MTKRLINSFATRFEAVRTVDILYVWAVRFAHGLCRCCRASMDSPSKKKRQTIRDQERSMLKFQWSGDWTYRVMGKPLLGRWIMTWAVVRVGGDSPVFLRVWTIYMSISVASCPSRFMRHPSFLLVVDRRDVPFQDSACRGTWSIQSISFRRVCTLYVIFSFFPLLSSQF